MIEERIKNCILRQSPLARARGVGADEPLLENGILDSLGILELVNSLEQEFDITVEDEDLVPENFQTIQRLAVYISGKRTAD